MPPKLVLFVVIGFITWLIVRDRKSRGMPSAALWLPLIWAFIVGSRPISEWLGTNAALEPVIVDYLEGSPLDRMIFFLMIAAGTAVLIIRRQQWSEILWNNKWLFLFYLYLLLSVSWSDYPYVSFKRLFKDIGNIVMALVVLSEVNPYEAVKAVLLRCTYLLIPLSWVTIKYFPDVGRYYDRWSHHAYFSGVAGDKNLLGMALFVCGLFLLNMFVETRKQAAGRNRRINLVAIFLLMLMTLWLLIKAHSVTAIVCTVLAGTVFLLLKNGGSKKLVVYGTVLVIVAAFVFSIFDMGAIMGSLLGRDVTLTGRTDIWQILLEQKINPLLGTGFYSFWLGPRIEDLSQKYHFILNEAHNGYLETYLNSGILGLSLLLVLLGRSLAARWRDLKLGVHAAPFGVSFLIGVIVYNISEATFNRLSIIWFAFMLIVLDPPKATEQEETSFTLETTASPQPARSILR